MRKKFVQTLKQSTTCGCQPFQPAQKDSAGFPWSHTPKAFSGFSLFSCHALHLTPPLLFCSESEENTHKNNQQNLYVLQARAWSCGEESGHRQANVSRKRTGFLYFNSRPNCLSSIIAPTPPSKCSYKADEAGLHTKLWARSFLQQHQGERTANKSCFANLGSLLLAGGEAGKEHLLQVNETGPQKLKQGEAAEQS